jgi:hypothetical protein
LALSATTATTASHTKSIRILTWNAITSKKTLSATGEVVEASHFTPENPLKEAKTATGGSFHSNGQVLILKLRDNSKNLSATSANHSSR